MNDAMTLAQFQEAVADQAGEFAGAWRAAAEKFSREVAAEGGADAVTAQRQYEILARMMAEEFSDLAVLSRCRAAAAEDAEKPGIGNLMHRYAEIYASRAKALLDSARSAEARLGAVASEAGTGIRVAESAFGSSAREETAPALNARRMAQGALEWGSTGCSATFGQAATGMVLAWTMGIAFGGIEAATRVNALNGAASQLSRRLTVLRRLRALV